jgi:hypothetical protein
MRADQTGRTRRNRAGCDKYRTVTVAYSWLGDRDDGRSHAPEAKEAVTCVQLPAARWPTA